MSSYLTEDLKKVQQLSGERASLSEQKSWFKGLKVGAKSGVQGTIKNSMAGEHGVAGDEDSQQRFTAVKIMCVSYK